MNSLCVCVCVCAAVCVCVCTKDESPASTHSSSPKLEWMIKRGMVGLNAQLACKRLLFVPVLPFARVVGDFYFCLWRFFYLLKFLFIFFEVSSNVLHVGVWFREHHLIVWDVLTFFLTSWVFSVPRFGWRCSLSLLSFSLSICVRWFGGMTIPLFHFRLRWPFALLFLLRFPSTSPMSWTMSRNG